MSSLYSNKVFLYLPDSSLRAQLESALPSIGMQCESPSKKVSSFESLRREAPLAKNLDFLFRDFVFYMQNFGVPCFIVINLVSDLSLPKEADPDRLLLLKTLMLAFIALSISSRHAALRAHIMIIVDRGDQQRAAEFEKKPAAFLAGMASADEQILARIDMLKKDPAAFSRLFFLRFQKSEDILKGALLMTKGFYDQIQARDNLEKKLTAYSAPAISTQNDAPAHLIFRPDDEALFVDGAPVPMTDEYGAYGKGIFHVTGSLSTKNIRAAADQIRAAVTGGAMGRTFAADDLIVIALQSGCSIDATVAAALAQLFISGLARYKKKKILVSTANDGILRKSQGYAMIKEFISIDRY